MFYHLIASFLPRAKCAHFSILFKIIIVLPNRVECEIRFTFPFLMRYEHGNIIDNFSVKFTIRQKSAPNRREIQKEKRKKARENNEFSV